MRKTKKRKLLSYLLVLSLFLCGLPAQTSSAADYKYAIDGVKNGIPCILNVSPKFNETHSINGYRFYDMSYYEMNDTTWMVCTVINVANVARDIVFPTVHIYDDAGVEIASFGGIIGELGPHSGSQFAASVTITGVIDAYDYTMTFSQSDYLDPDEELTIETGLFCTSHEIKENDTVTMICEESSEGVLYQWYWSESRSGGDHRIEGEKGRELVLSNVSLELHGRFYYCQINKKGKIAYTDRWELLVTPVATSKPTARPSPSPTASPNPTASPTPTVKPTASPTVKPTAKPTAEPTREPEETVNPSPSLEPDTTDTPVVPDFSNSPMPAVKPTEKPTVKPTEEPTASPEGTPDATPGQTTAPGSSASPEPSPAATPPQDLVLLKVKKIKVQQTADLKAKLTWKKITAARIAVMRAEKKSGPYRIIKQFSGSKAGYTDKTVKRGKTYYYKVVAHNEDLPIQLTQKDLTIRRITLSYLIPPVISVTKGNSGGQKYVQILLRKYEGQYADVYMKSHGRFQKLVIYKRTIRSYRRKYRFRYRNGRVTLYFRVRTYQMVKGRKRISPYSKTVRIKI